MEEAKTVLFAGQRSVGVLNPRVEEGANTEVFLPSTTTAVKSTILEGNLGTLCKAVST